MLQSPKHPPANCHAPAGLAPMKPDTSACTHKVPPGTQPRTVRQYQPARPGSDRRGKLKSLVDVYRLPDNGVPLPSAWRRRAPGLRSLARASRDGSSSARRPALKWRRGSRRDLDPSPRPSPASRTVARLISVAAFIVPGTSPVVHGDISGRSRAIPPAGFGRFTG